METDRSVSTAHGETAPTEARNRTTTVGSGKTTTPRLATTTPSSSLTQMQPAMMKLCDGLVRYAAARPREQPSSPNWAESLLVLVCACRGTRLPPCVRMPVSASSPTNCLKIPQPARSQSQSQNWNLGLRLSRSCRCVVGRAHAGCERTCSLACVAVVVL